METLLKVAVRLGVVATGAGFLTEFCLYDGMFLYFGMINNYKVLKLKTNQLTPAPEQ